MSLWDLAVVILSSLLQLKVILCTYLKKGVTMKEKNQLISCFFFNNTRGHKISQNHNEK